MGDREEQDAMPADHSDSETVGRKMAWFGWMFLFGTLGILTTAGLQHLVAAWCERDEFRKSHGWMMDQMQQLRQGETNCLVDPAPRFIEELLADAASAAAVRDVYLGGDLSDPRLGRLREFPNLKCVVFLFAEHHNAFLQLMHGAAAIEELSFDCTRLVRADVDQIASFPHLKSLGIGHATPFGNQAALHASDLDGLRGHPSLERLRLDAFPDGKGIDAVLQSIPRLREPSIGHATTRK
jgi:hypothetical protein